MFSAMIILSSECLMILLRGLRKTAVHFKRRSTMDEIRKGQIALLYLKNKIREEGVRLTPNMKRQIGNTAKAIGISVEEATEFAEIMIRELVEEAFGPKRS